jgi:hypothetical protein
MINNSDAEAKLTHLYQDFGELKGAFYVFKEQDLNSHDEIRDLIKEMSSQLSALRQELSIYKTIYKTIRFLLGALLLIVTLKFGDIKVLFHSIFG